MQKLLNTWKRQKQNIELEMDDEQAIRMRVKQIMGRI